MVDLDGLAPVGVVPALDLAFFDRDDIYGGAGLFEIFLRVSQFDLLVSVGGEDCDPFAVDLLGPSVLLYCSTWVLLAGKQVLPNH